MISDKMNRGIGATLLALLGFCFLALLFVGCNVPPEKKAFNDAGIENYTAKADQKPKEEVVKPPIVEPEKAKVPTEADRRLKDWCLASQPSTISEYIVADGLSKEEAEYVAAAIDVTTCDTLLLYMQHLKTPGTFFVTTTLTKEEVTEKFEQITKRYEAAALAILRSTAKMVMTKVSYEATPNSRMEVATEFVEYLNSVPKSAEDVGTSDAEIRKAVIQGLVDMYDAYMGEKDDVEKIILQHDLCDEIETYNADAELGDKAKALKCNELDYDCHDGICDDDNAPDPASQPTKAPVKP